MYKKLLIKDGIYVIFYAKSDKMGRLADKKQNILLRAIVGKIYA